MKKIIYTSADGRLCIVYPADKSVIERAQGRTLTEKEYEDRVWEKSVPTDAILPASIEDDAIPEDRYFRNAWKANANLIEVDLEKARAVHMDNLRFQRNEKLKELDIEFQIALEKGDADAQKVIAARKQQLRDMPATFNLSAINDLNALKASKPDYL